MPINYEFWMPVIAIVVSPLLAVQVQRWLDDLREKKKRKKEVFYALMATRAARVSVEHIRALNRIDIEWFGRRVFGILHRTRIEKEVLFAWKQYLDNLNTPADTAGGVLAWAVRGDELFYGLLYSISKSLGYDFDKITIKRGAYSPVRQREIEDNQDQIIKGLVAWLNGLKAVSVHIVQEPTSQAPNTAHAGHGENA